MASIRNSKLFGDYLESIGKSYKDVYKLLNKHEITIYNDILTDSGELIENDKEEYRGERDYHSSDNGNRTAAEKDLDCNVGNIQEDVFCIENIEFKPNEKATNKNVQFDKDITTKSLDIIHRKTGVEVEFKVCYCKEINQRYHTLTYRHRDGGFADFMRKGNIMIIYFPYFGKVAVFDKNRFKDNLIPGSKGAVKIIAENDYDEKTKKYWDKISIWYDDSILIDYNMFKGGNKQISDKVERIYKYKK